MGVRLQGGRLVRAHLPSLLISCSLVEPDYDIGVKAAGHQLGALLGLSHLTLEVPGAAVSPLHRPPPPAPQWVQSAFIRHSGSVQHSVSCLFN